jgi:predicted anti-sigma-YlaC factor YlaD
MSDCTNVEVRDLLPDLARGALSGQSLVAVEQHLATCASCRAELALVQKAGRLLGAAPAVNTARIADAVVRAKARRRAPAMSPASRKAWLLAASVAAVAAAAALVASRMTTSGDSDLPPVVITYDPLDTVPRDTSGPIDRITRTVRPPARAELIVGGGVSELADADLESLLRVLEGLDGQIDIEPAPVLPLVEGEV